MTLIFIIWVTSLMLNAYYDMRPYDIGITLPPIRPYVGIGMGPYIYYESIEKASPVGSTLGFAAVKDDSDATFAFTIHLGARADITRTLGFSLGYTYLHGVSAIDLNTRDVPVSLDSRLHEIHAGFHYRF